ncbi:MAG: sulfatase [Verrucomicrobiota bacterium]
MSSLFIRVSIGLFLLGLVALSPVLQARPNILFCIADDASYPHFGANGCQWVSTPGFDRVAKDGLLFTRAYTPNAKCSPSRACILTGRNSWQLEAACNHVPFFPAHYKTYVEILGKNGYFTGFTGKGWSPGDPGEVGGKRRQLEGQPWQSARMDPPAKAMSRIDYAGNFKAFLEECPEEAPWCFWYGCHEPHRAYEFGVGVNKGGRRIQDVDRVPSFWPDNPVVRTDMLDYGYEIEYFDSHLVRMLATLEEKGQLDNTLVVVTSDNGMPFPRIKGQKYEYSHHLPLAIMWPAGIGNKGRRIDDYVSFIDLAPTFLDVAGIVWETSGMALSPGNSLVPLFQSGKSGQVERNRDHVLIGKERHDVGRPGDLGYPIRGIVKDNFLYLENFEPSRWPAGNPETGYLNCDGSPTKTAILEGRRSRGEERPYWQWSFGKKPRFELYNLKVDPDCMKNLAIQAEYGDRRKAMRDQMRKELKEQGDPRIEGQGFLFEKYPYADEARKGFYEKWKKGAMPEAGWVKPADFEKEPVVLGDDLLEP